MGGTGRRCALAGCGLPIDDVVGRPQRLYCTPAHRMAARQSRRAAAQRERQARLTEGPDRSGAPGAGAGAAAQPGRVGPARPGGAPGGDQAGWAVLAEAALAIRAAYAEQQWLAAASPPAAAGPKDPAADGSVEQTLPEWARRADRVSDLSNGFWPGWSARFASAPGRHRAPEPPGRRRSLAAIGAAGIVAGGYALTWLSTAANPGPAPSVPVQAPPVPPSEQRWVARAQVTVTSIDEQLELIGRTEQLWRQRRPTDPPPPALEVRKDVLNQRKAVLTARIDTVRALHRARAEVAEFEDRLRTVEPGRTSPDEQRVLRERQREERRGQLDALEAEAAAAVRTLLPEDGERTTEIADEVLLDIVPSPIVPSPIVPSPIVPSPIAPAPTGSREATPSSEVEPRTPDVDPSPQEVVPRLPDVVPGPPSAPPPGVGAPPTEPPAAGPAGSRPAGKAERSAQRAESAERSTGAGEQRPRRPGESESDSARRSASVDSGATARRSGSAQRGSRRSDPARTHSRRGDSHRTDTHRANSHRADPHRAEAGDPERQRSRTAGSAERHRPTSPCDSNERPTHRTKRGHEDRPSDRTSEGKKQPETKRSRLSRSARDAQHDHPDGHQHRHREKVNPRTG